MCERARDSHWSPVRCLPALAVAALIAYWSLVTTPPPTTAALESLPETLMTGVSSVGAGPPSLRGLGRESLGSLSVRHALAYAVLGWTLTHALAGTRHSPMQRARLAISLATGYGAALECAQAIHPERVAAVADVVANAIGAAVGVCPSLARWRSQ